MIHIEYPSIDEAEFQGNPVLRGVIRTADLGLLRIDPSYQREILSPSTRRHILQALTEKQRLPDLELGMRGESWDFEPDSSEIIVLKDPVFIIDGQQRRATITSYLADRPGEMVRQGALIHFKTTMEWERKRFHALNLHQTAVSSGILLRNLRSTNPGIATFYGLSKTDKDFTLLDRVSWAQNMLRNDLLSASLYISTVLIVHGHMAGGITASTVNAMDIGVDRLTRIIGLPQLRKNIQEFWSSLDKAWGIKELTHRGAPWLTHSFLTVYANIFSDHHDFWGGTTQHILKVPSTIIEKLKKFPVTDPEIRSLSTGSAASRTTLRFHLEQHLNKYTPMTKRDVASITMAHRLNAVEARKTASGGALGKGLSRPSFPT